MRIKINLSSANDVPIPIEYNYNIYLNIRRTIFDFLQDHKPKLFNKYKKNFPEFTFSQLMIPERKIELGFIRIQGNYFSLFISSADDGFMEYLVKAINHQKAFPIYNQQFPLKKIEVLDEPDFKSGMRFKMLSPLLLIAVKDKKTHFIRPTDSDLNEIFASHLVETYNQMGMEKFTNSSIRLLLNQEYLERRKVITRIVTIRDIHDRTIFSPFSLEGEEELIRFAYRNGIGFKTNYGLGMIEDL